MGETNHYLPVVAVDLLRGLAALIGWDRIEVPGATGYTDTDYAAKGQYAIDALSTTDVICVHVEATDEASHPLQIDATQLSMLFSGVLLVRSDRRRKRFSNPKSEQLCLSERSPPAAPV